MSGDQNGDAKKLLDAWRAGDQNARDQLFNVLYADLRRVSAALLRSESNLSLSTGDLVSESAMRLMRMERIDWADKAHFLALAARAMRQALIDHARKKRADKRGHDRVTLVTGLAVDASSGVRDPEVDLELLDISLERLAAIDPARAEIVEMRYFGGMSLDEISEVTGRSVSTVKRSWRVARAWLYEAIKKDVPRDE